MTTTAEHPLPARKNGGAARKAEGFATPKEDKKPQCARMLPKRVLPIIFLPGVMGSNLRMSEKRKRELERKDNIAWRPDSLGVTNIKSNSNSPPRERQLRLDPLETSVDIYDPSGESDVSGDGRHSNVRLDKDFYSPLLVDDPPTAPNSRTAVQKARARGWGEVFFGSYGRVLQHLETRLNNTFSEGKMRQEWKDVIGVNPKAWFSDASLPQKPLTEDELKKVVTGCWFPVYAFGYNWLQSNGKSAKIIAARISRVINDLNEGGYECNQVIVVTHSMGGLVGRALVHPDYGDMMSKVLGIVHGVMPAIGAPAGYKRIRAGFEDPGLMSNAKGSLGAKVAGNYGDEVTAVLANAQGVLELLPTESYGNGWLRVKYKGRDLEAWPKRGDPFTEIYKIKGRWYSLFREEWINPSGREIERGGGTMERTFRYLEHAQEFHKKIANTFHPNSFAHYGADPGRLSFGEVVWEITESCTDLTGWHEWPIITDNRQGTLELVRPAAGSANQLSEIEEAPRSVYAIIAPPAAPGDQTVSIKSADYQLKSGKFRGVFRQTGYEHQSSYNDAAAIASTLYSIVQIAQAAIWKC